MTRREPTTTERPARGWAFPLGTDPQGRIATVHGERLIQQALLMVLLTPLGQRVMRPDYGCRVHELVFAPNDATTLGLATFYVEDAIRTWEPRVEVLRTHAQTDPDDPGRMLIDIRYRLRGTEPERRLVFPFDREPPVPARR